MISHFILYNLMGWTIDPSPLPKDLKKAIFVVAPHTSNWDFFIGWLAFRKLKIKVKFLIKKEWFRFPIGGLLKCLGGLPVDRSKNNNTVNEVANLLNNSNNLFIVITPEGTRSYNAHWKKGFYYIAMQAKVPLVITYLDYKKKQGGLAYIFEPSGNFNEDFKKIQDFYRGVHAKYPEKFNLSEKQSI